MNTLTYALRFYRPPGSAKDAPLLASNISITTVITDAAVTATIDPLSQNATASMQVQPKFNPDGSFTETGTITFGDPAANNLLKFSTIRLGQLNPNLCPEDAYTSGTVMWRIDEGTGFFAEATGAITSNFLVNKSTNELTAYQFGVIHLPQRRRQSHSPMKKRH